MSRLCSIPNCERPLRARGWCGTHYARWRSEQSGPLLMPLEERFWAKVDRGAPDECWLWRAAQNGKGYGNFKYGEEVVGAHRVAYELTHGPIPDGLHIDHLCRVTLCVNPAHLEPVTRSENTRRGMTPSAVAVRTGRCAKGHELTPDNLYVRPDGKGRACLTCLRRRSQIHNARRRTKEDT